MFPAIVTKDPTAVQVEVQKAYLTIFPQGDRMFVPKVFGWAIECFTGHYDDYSPVDARYHDFEHTLQGTLCMSRLLHGRYLAGARPELSQRIFQLGLMAILLHDTGYLKKRDDREGTGAKYTITHVARSAEFAATLLQQKGLSPADIKSVQNMIHCTGVDTNVGAIPFQSEEEKIIGFALGSSDLLGQMAADDYVDKLPILYGEFDEAIRFSRNQAHFIGGFANARDLMQKTPLFWEKFVLRKLNRDFGGLVSFLNDPYPDGSNPYVEHIEANMERIRERLNTNKAQTV